MTLSLNDLAQRYALHLNQIPFQMVIEDSRHVFGSHSVYVLELDLHTDTKIDRRYYIGRTGGDPRARASKHKSSFRCCRVSTFVGVSVLFTPDLFDITKVEMRFSVLLGGLTISEARAAEKEQSAFFHERHGDAVLTRPNGASKRLFNKTV